MQLVVVGHPTSARKAPPAGVGLGVVTHAVPFQRSTSVLTIPVVLLVAFPTAKHTVPLPAQATAANPLTEPGTGGGARVQDVPSNCSMPVAEFVKMSPPPTAQRVVDAQLTLKR